MNNWISMLYNTRSNKNILGMFGKKRRNNRGMLWASAIGLGASAVAISMRRNRNSDTQANTNANNHRHSNSRQTIENIMKSLPAGKSGQIADFSALATEFSKELFSDKKQTKEK